MPDLSPRMALARAALRMQPDGRLVDLTRDGHDAAFEEIVRRYRSQLVGFAGGIVADHRAEDVVQEALTRAHAALLRDDAEIALKPWLYTIVRNRSLNDLRDEPVHDHLDEDYDGVPQPPAVAERRARLAGLVAGIQALPEAQREALVKREFEGRGHTEIASQMALSPGAVRQLIFRARSTLRDAAGLMIPGPVLRLMLEAAEHREAAAGAGAAAAGAGGAAMALKASVAVLAGGVAIGGGLALRDDHRNDRSRVAVAAEPRPDRAAGREDGGAAGTGGSQTADDQPGGRSGPGAGGGERDDDRGGDGDDGHSGSDDSDSSGPSSSSGPGGDDGGGGGEDGRESDDDHSGPGGGGDDEPDEPDDSSGPGGGGGDDEPDERDEPEEPDEPDEPEEDNSGPGGGGERPEEPREELDEPDL